MTGADHPTDESTFHSAPSTGDAPPFRPPMAGRRTASAQLLVPGQKLGDYDIVRVLGAGSFAQVVLARQVSLDRLVALKISANQSHEARTLASLEHTHIVQVFSEQVHPELGLRLLCMQYVAGLTLAQVISALAKHAPKEWSGRLILNILDELANEPAILDPTALEGRAFLQGCDFNEAVCWLGARLAEALAHAHSKGVLHRDIKPANILLNRYGRPFLADFNIAQAVNRLDPSEPSAIAGTLGYMAPEHLEAFLTGHDSAGRIDVRSDLYSLGVVLYELLTGALPFQRVPEKTQVNESLQGMVAERQAQSFAPRQLRPDVSEVLDQTVRRCLDPEPARRYQTAVELAAALDGCRTLQQVERSLPPAGPIARGVARHPALGIAVLTLLPHFLGSAVNIPYNAIRIVGDLNAAQQTCFRNLVLGYNLIVYPICIGLLCLAVLGALRSWRKAYHGATGRDELAPARQRMLRLSTWAVGISCAGWLPGAFLFPLGLRLWSDPVTWTDFGHFVVSFTISGLIALTYSYFGVQYAVVRVLYPKMWADAAHVRDQARTEFTGLPGRLRLFQLLAGLIPLAGAILMVTVGPTEMTVTFRLLITALIALGMVGFGMALLVSSRLMQVMTAFVGK